MKYTFYTEKLTDGTKIKLRVSDVILKGNAYGEMREIICPKCSGGKTSFSYVENRITGCTLCKSTGKMEVFCSVMNNYMAPE